MSNTRKLKKILEKPESADRLHNWLFEKGLEYLEFLRDPENFNRLMDELASGISRASNWAIREKGREDKWCFIGKCFSQHIQELYYFIANLCAEMDRFKEEGYTSNSHVWKLSSGFYNFSTLYRWKDEPQTPNDLKWRHTRLVFPPTKDMRKLFAFGNLWPTIAKVRSAVYDHKYPDNDTNNPTVEASS